MPLVRIAFRAGKSAQYRQAAADDVHCALVEVAGVAELDRFQVVPVAPEDWSFGDGKAQYAKTDPS